MLGLAHSLYFGVFALSSVGAVDVDITNPIYHALTVFGLFRTPRSTPVAASDFVVINDTVQCEDIHYYAPANKLFTACEDNPDTRYVWFPPLVNMIAPPKTAGSLHVIDPTTFKSTRLSVANFSGPFVTHGIDVIADPERPTSAVYIFAVNHVPSPEFYAYARNGSTSSTGQALPPPAIKANSVIELFHHVLNTTVATHIRSIAHRLIVTPNDIYAASPSHFFVTNDHEAREGVAREYEDWVPTAKYSTTISVELRPTSGGGSNPAAPITNAAGLKTAYVDATTALTGIHNNNGMGHGAGDEVLVTSALSGILYRAEQESREERGEDGYGTRLVVVEEIGMNGTVDNPSYFRDPYAGVSGGRDASGYVLGGLARVLDLGKSIVDREAKNGVLVWYVTPGSTTAGFGGRRGWQRKVLFEDDGSRISSASAAVLVAIDPKLEGGKKKAWLFVTGFLSKNAIAVKVDL